MKLSEWASVILLTVFLSLSGCQRQDSVVAEEEAPAEIEEQVDAPTFLEGKALDDGQESPHTGEWIETDGSRFCDGYMTRVEAEEYCSAEIPEDWVPLEFNDETYYVQPLTDVKVVD